MLEEPLDADFQKRLEQVLGSLKVSETAAEPADALEAVDRLPPKGAGRRPRGLPGLRFPRQPVAGVRVRWRKSLKRLDESGAQLHLVNCVDAVRPNLAIAALRPGPGTRAAGVPLLGGSLGAQFRFDARKTGCRCRWKKTAMRGRRSWSKRFPPGKHRDAALSGAVHHRRRARDRGPAGNRRGRRRQLALAGDRRAAGRRRAGDRRRRQGGQDAFFLATALAPGGKITSGLQARRSNRRATCAIIRSISSKRSICSISPGSRPAEIAALEAFVTAGGGLGFFLGELSRADFFNAQLYRDGEGLFPLPLAGPAELAVDRLEKSPDLEVDDHPIFSRVCRRAKQFLEHAWW